MYKLSFNLSSNDLTFRSQIIFSFKVMIESNIYASVLALYNENIYSKMCYTYSADQTIFLMILLMLPGTYLCKT